MAAWIEWLLVGIVVAMGLYSLLAEVRDMRAADRQTAARQKEKG